MLRLQREGRALGQAASKLNDLEMATMLHGGATLQEIGDVAGLTRERVRQRLERIGVTAASRTDVTKLIDVIRHLPVASIWSAGQRIGVDGHAAKRAILELGLFDAVERLFRLRRRALDRRKVERNLAALRQYAAMLGRTPTTKDLNRRDRPATLSSAPTLQAQFGSLTNAMAAAGLEPNRASRRPARRDRARAEVAAQQPSPRMPR